MTATYYGFNPPFYGGPQNIMSRQEDERLIKNDILQLILTVPGERVMRPDFGVNLLNFIFEPLTTADLFELQAEIEHAIRTFEPRVNVELVQLIPADDDNGLTINIVVTMRKDPKRRLTIEQFIDLATQSGIETGG